ncbi:S8 family serine peptidase [Ornithinimicrobium sufpigmenti]|uniref:S8 family serine peptidase n=1 Tax=Ornithinimicrobium sufpigmenti TaxID=2508882 RepID=UPI001EE0F80E|nr:MULTISPECIES: cell wall-binding repeat-containing protein [unclassified Ornithinimicrobium]
MSAELQAEGRADVWVRFAERPDMSQFAAISDWNERGQAVVDALQAAAESSQGGLRASLDKQDVDYQAFWATNSVRVSGADADLVTSMSLAAGVEGIYPTMQIEIPEIVPTVPEKAPNAVEWGVDDVNAPEVWADGVEGQDIVVASIDTGAQWDHPALIQQYRGNLGDGEVDHNYSWFDASGTSPDEPADFNGHGTHVTGTMVGDDGGDNQIGVAPGAKWIAANGCCPSDEALMSSGQWMLEPTDLNGENPDVSKRPHIINNSWGTTVPSNDPFMSDVIEAWAAAGQFGVFANGNNGPGCNTSGAPGSLAISYSVGNYTSSHVIAPGSSRGPGENGEIKPDISAPGTAVRSSVPGNAYASYNGTSMASPHVAGAVALAWSASPILLGDVEGTRNLLDGTAIDTADDQCGGTPENNNVFGEGRLDAAALVDEAPIDDAGTLTGVVTDADDDSAIASASVQVVGPMERTLTTNSEGVFNTMLVAGDYDVTVSAFGYETHTQTVTIEAEETTTVNVALETADAATIDGVITDGSGYGFPLYARIAVDGTPEATYSDPETGAYSLNIPSGSTYTLSVQVQYPGYTTPSREVTVSGDATENFAVEVDAITCNAPGYHVTTEGLWETFDEETAPEGWDVVDHQGNDQVWRFDDPGDRGNQTGGEGGFAVVNSDDYGSGQTQNTTLVTPSVDMSGDETPAVGFKSDYYRFTNDSATVRVSLDGGETWEDVEEWTESRRGPREELVPLPMAAGESDVRIGFNYEGTWGWWWQIDDVFVGERSCVPAGEGGYVVGNVHDTADQGIVGATVTNLDDEDQTAVTTATPADENLADGFYWIFSDTPGENTLQASATNYETTTQEVTVVDGDVVRADFSLGSGLVVVEPGEIESTQDQDEVVEHSLTFTNDGTSAVEVELLERDGGFTAPAGAGVDVEPTTLDVPTSFAAFADDEAEVGTSAEGDFAPSDTWESLPDYPRITMDNRVVNVDGDHYVLGGTTGTAAFADVNRLDAETQTWQAVAPMPQAASAVNAEAVAGEIVVSGGWVASATTTDTYVYDAGADSWTQAASAPTGVSASGTAVIDGIMYVIGGCSTNECTPMSNNAMAYDVASDTWETLANYPTAAAFPTCGAVDGELVCSGGNPGSGGIASTYVYDAGADAWESVADAPTPHWAAGAATANSQLVVQGGVQGAGAGAVSNATYAFDGDQWTTLAPATTPVYRGDISCGIVKVGGSIGGFNPVAAAEHLPGWDDCVTTTDVEWLELDPQTFTVEAGESVEVTVATDSTGLDLGTYSAAIRVRSNTPQSVDDIPVTMTVTEEEPPVGVIEVDPTSVEHTVEFGGSDSTDVTFSNTGEADAEVSLSEDVDWLSVDPEEFTVEADDSVDVAFTTDAAGLDAGTYTTQVEVTTDTGQELDAIEVTLIVSDEQVPPVGVIEVDPTSVEHTVEFGGSDSTDVTFSNTGEADAEVSLSEDVDWLSVDPEEFTVEADDSVDVAFTTDAAGLDAGTYTTQVEVTTDTGQELEAISVTLVVAEEAEAPFEVQRWSGTNRYGTAAAVSGTYESGAEVVFLATGQDYPDALTGSALAGSVEAPVLLTRPGALPNSTKAELVRLAPERVVVLGGDGAVKDAVLAEAGALTGAPVERVSGTNRYGTAAAVAAEFGGQGQRVFVATGVDYPDALSAAARAGALDSPVLLVRRTEIPSATAAALDALEPSQITVLGGEGAVDQGVVNELRQWAPTTRTGGLNRWVTSARLFAEVASAETVYVASGQNWPDALAGGAKAGGDHEPLLITRQGGLPGAIEGALQRLWPQKVVVLGGTTAVSNKVIEELEDLLERD